MITLLLSRSSNPLYSPFRRRCWEVYDVLVRRSMVILIDPDDAPRDIRRRMRHVENEPKPSGDSIIRTKPFTRQERRAKYVRVVRV